MGFAPAAKRVSWGRGVGPEEGKGLSSCGELGPRCCREEQPPVRTRRKPGAGLGERGAGLQKQEPKRPVRHPGEVTVAGVSGTGPGPTADLGAVRARAVSETPEQGEVHGRESK